MRSRSWMAALSLVAGLALWAAAPIRADDKAPVRNTINLQLQITGLSADGTVVEIKPGSPACKFAEVKKTIRHAGTIVRLAEIAIDAESTGADGQCSFLITIKEPGQPPKEFRRGVRLAAKHDEHKSVESQTLKIYLTAPSVAARDSGKSPKR